MIRVFIVALAPMLQVGLRTILTTGDMQVVGEASVPAELAAVDLAGIDVIVLSEEALLEDLQRIFGENRTPALVVLSSNNRRLVMLLNALSPRGWGVVPADASTAQLQAAVAAAAQGLTALPTALAEQLLEQRAVVELSDIDTTSPDEALTAREREVLELLSQGLPNKLIARRLQISEHTVKFHVSSIYAKLGATSRTDAVSRGVRRGLITL
jgi:DNA-binding NarL/FixJ family response regulator